MPTVCMCACVCVFVRVCVLHFGCVLIAKWFKAAANGAAARLKWISLFVAKKLRQLTASAAEILPDHAAGQCTLSTTTTTTGDPNSNNNKS